MADNGGIGLVEAVVIDVSDLDRAMVFWSALTGLQFGPSDEPHFRQVKLASGLNIALQEVPEAKVGKNRVHLDLQVQNVEAALKRVEAIGGTFVARVDNQIAYHVVCADPDGNEFCLEA